MVVAKQSKLQARTVDLLEVAEELVAYFDYCRRTGTYGALYDPGHWEPLRDAIDSAREAVRRTSGSASTSARQRTKEGEEAVTHDEWMRVRRERDDLVARVERLEAERDDLRAQVAAAVERLDEFSSHPTLADGIQAMRLRLLDRHAEVARLREALEVLVAEIEAEHDEYEERHGERPQMRALQQARAALNHQGDTQ